ncbi:DMT family transporter [Ralstonia solanacearum]|uniref:DMT family transporter n=1 Tax=Ralstonia solanacearum TaxID=305 RepID=UPI00078C92E4|nr:SMR family transporter [Ralstonia solanacearum]AMP40390.1 quaternary ammonium transporter [Ralstonia solanacearum]AXV89247.1 QacE family quaternary ammonium compound efflux SMR transporter [Ralstonia solanacearum]AXW08711.1 QacE family quaternary ammonium compound efflux SMR transporter [Ralstonia solanacearum]AXW26495.1 QacE family quaternary ammonium compound efflux SMR transporter [Ralstonia solanacearum]AXW64575.1 QacE family quaternary ammonium compound efflux SMR transporter [Ralstoni
MNPVLIAYGWLAAAIVSEVMGTTFLAKSEQFSRMGPATATVLFYTASFYFLSQALKGLPLGLAYAIWGGVGIVLTAIISLVVSRQMLDLPTVLGIALIVSGVVVTNVFSKTIGH